MNGEPPIKRAVAFVDGQNLFHAAREAFGYTCPNYDVAALTGEEKGIDVRIALDVIALAHRREYDVALVFSQDQDLNDRRPPRPTRCRSRLDRNTQPWTRAVSRWKGVYVADPCPHTQRKG